MNEIKGSTGDQRSEDTDTAEKIEYYKQMNRNEEPKPRKPTTPPSSPTIEDYSSGKKKKKNFDFTSLSPLHKRNSDDGEKRFVSKFDIDGRRERTNTSD